MNDGKTRLSVERKPGREFLDPQRIDWNLMRSFQAVADLGSVTRAVGVLGISQPTISRQIAELERLLGVALFERTARGLKLTTAGADLVEPARRMLAAAQVVSLAATGRNRELAGTVRITASEIMCAYVLPEIFASLRSTYPEIQIELVASNRVDNLLTREADVAIRMVRPEQSGLIARRIGDFPIGFYAHRDYLARLDDGRGHDDPARYDWIGLDQSSQLIEGFKRAGFAVDKTFFAFRCDNQVVGWQAVLAGLGVGVSLRMVAEQFPQLVRLMEQRPLPSLPVWVTAHRELRDTPRMRAVVDFLTEALSERHRDK